MYKLTSIRIFQNKGIYKSWDKNAVHKFHRNNIREIIRIKLKLMVKAIQQLKVRKFLKGLKRFHYLILTEKLMMFVKAWLPSIRNQLIGLKEFLGILSSWILRVLFMRENGKIVCRMEKVLCTFPMVRFTKVFSTKEHLTKREDLSITMEYIMKGKLMVGKPQTRENW